MLLDLTMIFPLQDVDLNSPCSRCVSGDRYPRQKGQPLSLQTDGGGGKGARGKHGLSPWGLWLYRIKSRGDPLTVWEFDRRHNFTIHTASQVEVVFMPLICPLSERKLKYKYRPHIKDPYKYYNLTSFPESWKFGCLWGDFMSEDTTGSLTDASTTVM